MKFKSNSTNPFYDKSIFREIELYSPAHIKWTTSVLNKLRSTGILPTFIQKDKDFDSFWGWICHFFAVIVIYGRQFLDIFTDKDLFWEFLKQKDLYRDTRVDLYENLEIYNNQDIPYIPILNKKIVAGYPIDVKGYICSDYLPIEENNILTMKSSNIFEGDLPEDLKVEVGVAFYDEEKKFVQGYTTELSKEKLEEITIEKNLYKGVEKIFYKGIINKRIRQLNKIDGIIYSSSDSTITVTKGKVTLQKAAKSDIYVTLKIVDISNGIEYTKDFTIYKNNLESEEKIILDRYNSYIRFSNISFTSANINVYKDYYCWDNTYSYYHNDINEEYIPPTDVASVEIMNSLVKPASDIKIGLQLINNETKDIYNYEGIILSGDYKCEIEIVPLPLSFNNLKLISINDIETNTDGTYLYYIDGTTKPENPSIKEVVNSEINGGLSVDLLIETDKNIKYFVFSYPAIYLKKSENVFLVKPYISGEGYYDTKNLTKESLLNIYNTFRKRGTLNSLNYIKNICETNLSDLFYSNYLNKDNIGWYLNKAYPLNKFLTKNIDLSNILIKSLIPLSNGEFVEFYDNFLSFSDSNCLKIKWERRLEFSVQKVIVFCTLYDKDKKAFYPPMINTIINTEINGLVIENIPKGITELSIPIKVIEDARQKDLGKNLINIDYTKEIYLFLNNITYNSINYELKYIQLKAIHFITDINQEFITADDNLGKTINKLVIGNSLSNLDLEQINFSLNLLSLKDKLIKFKLDSNSILNFEKTLTQRKRNQISLNVEEKKDSNRKTVSVNNTNSLFKINLKFESIFDCNLTFNNQDNIQRFNKFYFTLIDEFGNPYNIVSVLRSYIPAHTTERANYYDLEQSLNCKKVICRKGSILSSSSGKESFNIKINGQVVYVGALDFTSSYEIEFNLTNPFELSANQKYTMDGVVNYIIN